ncbi:uncharacterized protein LOC117821116 [Notolabrus celidotus]|uniref:uncharacterized protein LOC117821116 n=1 Tax=Notolabrus celidotus TaxID=1203425 RepID=UPI0014907047|nr:uncharacterized protein LOC117821116 [Notolabrus celidotus]XP_034551084.1 uncharacterized protein LOC117821116 [Notolabrus celidotus]
MDGVLEGAAVLCAFKLACSLFFLPSLADSHSPVSFCCCCLLFFTDFLVAVFLTFLSVFEPWLTVQTSFGDLIALRFLLFLSHTYGMMLLLTAPLIAVETLTRLLWPPCTVAHRTEGQAADDGLQCYVWEKTVEKEDTHKEKRFSHVVSYLCCLSVWVVVAFNISWRWKREEMLASSCLHSTNSLMRCLPNLLSPMPSFVNPCWGMAFLSLLMLLLTTSISLDRRHGAPACVGQEKYRGKSGIGDSSDRYWQDFVLVPSAERVSPCKSEPGAVQCVDPEKTESSCTVHRTYSWNSMQMSTSHHGDFVLIPPDFISAGKGGQEYGRTKRGILLTFIEENHVDSEHRSQFCRGQWGFPCLGVDVMIGFVGVLSIFVLPLNLSVNILLIRTIETLLELCIKYLVSSAANTNNTSTLHNETLL